MSIRPIKPTELLDLADELAGRGAGAGKPRTIRLRRSISTAYYAVFHELSRRSVERLLETSVWTAREAAVARWVAHTDLATLARAATGSGPAPVRDALGAVHADVERVAQNFLDLQDARHAADYDHTFDVSKTTAISYADLARDAVARSGSLIATGDVTYRRFLGLTMGAVKVAKAR